MLLPGDLTRLQFPPSTKAAGMPQVWWVPVPLSPAVTITTQQITLSKAAAITGPWKPARTKNEQGHFLICAQLNCADHRFCTLARKQDGNSQNRRKNLAFWGCFLLLLFVFLLFFFTTLLFLLPDSLSTKHLFYQITYWIFTPEFYHINVHKYVQETKHHPINNLCH